MILVVDTNIVFSAIINDKGKIGELLLNKPAGITFLSPIFLLDELQKHAEKILKITKYNKDEFEQIKSFVLRNIEFIDSSKIDAQNHATSYNLLKDIDENDTPFIALALQFDAILWTGDKRLMNGLLSKNFNNIISTDILYNKYFGL